ncbi:MAG: helix-turn-helix domain-containing protein [Proteobacteria bacterium]|nr:helix-turn-helix domain-containing protein [Pseudomonadota bacterium]
MNGMTDDQILEALCRQCGVGSRALRGDARDSKTVGARRAIAVALRKQAGWIVARIARVMERPERTVYRMLSR